MQTCIYCRRSDPPCGFSREHVLQAAFGSFKNALTLLNEVCGDCNQYFGDRLDIVLARDSVEAMLRLDRGLKDPATMRGMLKERVQARLPRDGTTWGGAHIEFTTPRPGRLGLGGRLLPQVGFERRDGGGWDYFTEAELSAADDLQARFDTEYKLGWYVLGETDEIHERLIALMRERGVPVKGVKLESGMTPEGPREVSVTWVLDVVLARAIAKIAMNYLAKTQGGQFARRPEFDDVRRFIREGAGRPADYLRLLEDAVVESQLGGEPPTCHVVTLYWAEGQPWILCRLTLFNRHAYLVRLCTGFHGPLWREVKSGHVYDLDALEVLEYRRTAIMPPEGWAF